jgi:Zn-dependent protease with chaperone function
MASEQQYIALIERLETQSRQAPGVYKFKLGALAALGFLVLGGSVLLALGMSIGLVLVLVAISPILLAKLIKVVWIPIVFGWMILRALWVKFEPPAGYRLRPGEAPALEAEVERLRAATGAPKLDGIIIDPEMNAGASTLPRAMGLLGNRHYLALGLPLMQSLDRDQLAAVVAHEFGHFGGGHSRFAGWIYHVRISWLRVLHELSASQAMLTGIFLRFFRWYAPYFNAYSFVLARSNEYEADAASARVVGPAVAAQALIRTDLCAHRLHKDFWPGLHGRIADTPEPPALLFREMAERLGASQLDADARLHEAMARKPDYDDTHPTLAQRLAALNAVAAPVGAPRQTAAEALLGSLLPELEHRFSAEWRDGIAAAWEEEHRKLGIERERLDLLDRDGAHSAEERIEYARLVERLRPEQAALPLYRAAFEAIPENAFVRFRLGALLLEGGEAEGAVHLRRAMELDPDATEPACQLLYAHYREKSDTEGCTWVERTMDALYGRHAQAARARGELRGNDELLPHGLDEHALDALQTTLRASEKVKRAWLVRKHIDDPDASAPSHFVLLVELRGFVLDEGVSLNRVIERVELPGTFIGFTRGHDRGMAKRVKQVAHAQVFGA